MNNINKTNTTINICFFKHEVESEYSKQEIGEMLEMIDEGNKSSGGIGC